MGKEIDILGVRLHNCTVREAILEAGDYLDGSGMNAIEDISVQMLVGSESDPILRDVLSSLDLALIGEKEILREAGLATAQRVKETEGKEFAAEFFRQLERGGKRVFLLGEKRRELELSKETFGRRNPALLLVGEYAMEECTGDPDTVINEMNATTPDVVVSVLPSPLQEHFFWEHRNKMDAAVWYGMGGIAAFGQKRGLLGSLRRIVQLKRLKGNMAGHGTALQKNREDGFREAGEEGEDGR